MADDLYGMFNAVSSSQGSDHLGDVVSGGVDGLELPVKKEDIDRVIGGLEEHHDNSIAG